MAGDRTKHTEPSAIGTSLIGRIGKVDLRYLEYNVTLEDAVGRRRERGWAVGTRL